VGKIAKKQSEGVCFR